ncbi:hypothetical protein Nepgr_004177 [Nepenthes gracilis]|uniref:Serine/threonine-protein kinase 19 n=1 Tax=Nepenthes gracilis TaxID=150966 RepID=A0AAD3XES6_NEPGR|nr:hypothetical protein Nepgr_004177 [Nepenthes gracilis]
MEEKSEGSPINKKRRRQFQHGDLKADGQLVIDEEDSPERSVCLEDSLSFSDTLVALRMMRAQFPKIEKVSIRPFILRSQLYSSIKDRTQVDRELESLRRDRVLRIFKLSTGQDDHAILFLDDYVNQVDHAMKMLETKKKDNVAVFDWFKTHVIMSKLEPSIDHHELCLLLSNGGNVKDEHISLLINAGVLTRQLIDPNMYWFAIPNIGSLLKGLSQGRKELLSFLNRRKYKEMMLAHLEKKRLQHSLLDMRFHLRFNQFEGASLLIVKRFLPMSFSWAI